MASISTTAHALENQLLQVLSQSPLGKEAALSYRIEELEGRRFHQEGTPTVYFSAPSAYLLTITPERRQVWQSQIGIRSPLPYGSKVDLSWNHSLEYINTTHGTTGDPRSGFIQNISVQTELVVPLYFNSVAFLSTSIANNVQKSAFVRYSLAQNKLAKQFIETWYSLYREYITLELNRIRTSHTQQIVQTYSLLVASGDRSIHELWQAENNHRIQEIQLLRSELEIQKNREIFHSQYGFVYPENPQLPESDIDLSPYFILPQVTAELLLFDLENELDHLEYVQNRTESAPALQFSFQISGPQEQELQTFADSFSGQFRESDWTPTFSVGFSLTSNLGPQSTYQETKSNLNKDLLILQQTRGTEELLIQIDQLKELYSQYQIMVQREEQSTEQMMNHLQDMEQKFERGELDLLQLNDIRFQFEQTKIILQTSRSYLQELNLLIQLLGTGLATY